MSVDKSLKSGLRSSKAKNMSNEKKMKIGLAVALQQEEQRRQAAQRVGMNGGQYNRR